MMMTSREGFESLLRRGLDELEQQEIRRLSPTLLEDEGVCARLSGFAELVERWSRVHNLVSFRSRQELVQRHILDALAGITALGESGALLDVGSGAGFPGLPLLIARPQWHGVLIEPRQKRWTFLKLVCRELGLAERVRVLGIRYQDLDQQTDGESYNGSVDGSFDAITVRALSCDQELAEWSRAHLRPAGELMVWTTEENLGSLRDLAGWHVISSPLARLQQGRLARLKPCKIRNKES